MWTGQTAAVRTLGSLLLIASLLGCGDDKSTDPGPDPPATITDAQLRSLAVADGSWTWYKNSGDMLDAAAGSGHVEQRIRTRYNALAATQLDANGRVRANPSFPDSSLIVKELFTGPVITTLAVMMKLRGSTVASSGGWVWGYFDGQGGVREPSANRGAGCTGCHSSGLDFTRMNDSHP